MPPAGLQSKADRLTREAILSRIPAFPPVVLQALDLLSGESTEIPELVRLITSDATLAAQVLRLANSALFAFPTEIDTVHHAVTALGLSRVQSLIVTIATTNYMRAALQTEALTSCWRHTLATAILSRELARAAGMEPERAYTFGLLHDIGRLGLLVSFPDSYDSLVSAARRDAVSLLDLEMHRFGMDHCEAGRTLVTEWGLPQEICVAAGRHHDPPQGGPFDTCSIVHYACRMADSLGSFVCPPLQPVEFEDLIGLLPAPVREKFAPLADRARGAVVHAMEEGQITNCNSFHPRPDLPPAAPPSPREDPPWLGLASRVPAWDFMIVGVTVAVFAAVMLMLAYWGQH